MKRMTIPCLLAAALLAGGCSILPEKTQIAQFAPTVTAADAAAWPAVRAQLVVVRPTSDQLIDSARILVRPTPGELQVYRGAQWIQPAPDILQSAVLHLLEDSGRIPGVGRRGAGVAGDFELLIDIRRFDADYAGAAVPTVMVEVNAKLVSGRENAVVATRVFRAQQVAGSTAIPDVARAFDAPLSQVANAIAGWTLQEISQREPRR